MKSILGILFATGFVFQRLLGDVIVIENEAGEDMTLFVNSEDRFSDVVDQVYSCFPANGSNMQWDFSVSHANIGVIRAKANEKKWRDYNVEVTSQQKKDIAYIVKTLAYDSLLSIGAKTSTLNRLGEGIDHLHPFRFLMAIFTDEELKAGAAAIQTQISWVRNGFLDGIINSFKAESARDNVLPFVKDFARIVQIDVALIQPTIEKGNWKELVNILIDKIPRSNNPNRYNM